MDDDFDPDTALRDYERVCDELSEREQKCEQLRAQLTAAESRAAAAEQALALNQEIYVFSRNDMETVRAMLAGCREACETLRQRATAAEADAAKWALLERALNVPGCQVELFVSGEKFAYGACVGWKAKYYGGGDTPEAALRAALAQAGGEGGGDGVV